MKTIVIANQKGGSGKSTSTVHLAVAAEQAGDGPVLITDTDPQGSTGDWFNQRKRSGIDTPRYAPLALSDLSNNLRALKDAGASYLFIDTAPSIGSVNGELFAVADLILIPLNPTPTDLRALVKGLPTIKRSGKPFNFMLARVRPNLRNNDGVAVMALGTALGLWFCAARMEQLRNQRIGVHLRRMPSLAIRREPPKPSKEFFRCGGPRFLDRKIALP